MMVDTLISVGLLVKKLYNALFLNKKIFFTYDAFAQALNLTE